MELLHEKPYEKITATDIINRADVNRSTFYAHYPDVQGLVEEMLNEIVTDCTRLIAELDYRSIFRDPTPFLRPLVQRGLEYRELYTRISQSYFALQQTEQIKAALLDKALNTPEIPEEIRRSRSYVVRVNFFIGGIFETYRQWTQGGLDYSSDEIVEEVATLIISSEEVNRHLMDL